MEGLALTGAWTDEKEGLVGLIVLEMGGSSDLCAWLQPNEPVILMGPTGTPTHTPAGETVLLAGGGLGNAVLFSIGRALQGGGLEGGLLRRLQEAAGPLQGRGDRGGVRRGGLVERRGPRLHRRPAAGQDLRRQHRAVDPDLRQGRPRPDHDQDPGCRPHPRHRLRRHDERGGAGAARGAEALSSSHRIARSAPSTRRCNA